MMYSALHPNAVNDTDKHDVLCTYHVACNAVTETATRVFETDLSLCHIL